jgi:hypothetical protein
MRQHLSLTISVVIACFLISPNAFSDSPATIVIVSGLPIKKDTSDIGGTEQVELSKSERWNYRLEIVKRGDRYYWASRENKELLLSKSGEFYNFVEPKAAGYIRVIKTEDGVLYMEHLTLGMKNLTYWGIATEHVLP